MRTLIVLSFTLAAATMLAAPASAQSHGAKKKRHGDVKAYRTTRKKRLRRRYRSYRVDDCPVEVIPEQYPGYPYWAVCGFTPKTMN